MLRWRASSTPSKPSSFIIGSIGPALDRRDIFAFIEGFYSRTRLLSAIGYIPPIEMELKAA
ncbi:protein of unknown function [Bradyrhizobium vignae]|uniref:Integrase catalytic domain-containing protein n=1 Tax=Bradyrhizobium vignae TaxID=1549949 RepID=A0A2U3QA55_9BRAD|nr:protein of unknown function [Bradyrhizobium vignae]